MTAPRVFISHANEDRDFVEREIVALLKLNGINTWFAPDDIRTGSDREKSVRQGLESCDWFLVVLSPRGINSKWVRAEVHWAIDQRDGKFVPVLMEDCDWSRLHLFMRLLHYVDFRSRTSDSKRRLLDSWTRNSNAEEFVIEEIVPAASRSEENPILVIGPTFAGKTCFVGALEIAAGWSTLEQDGLQCSVAPHNLNMQNLCEAARSNLTSGDLRFDATSAISDYAFDLRVKVFQNRKTGFFWPIIQLLNRFWQRKVEPVVCTTFRVFDGPGGAVFSGSTNAKYYENPWQDQFYHMAENARGLIICLDSTDEKAGHILCDQLPRILARFVQSSSFERIVILLNKADHHFSKYGDKALSTLLTSNPWNRAAELLSPISLRHSLTLIPPDVEIACGWSSAFGFIKDKGLANYDPITQTLPSLAANRPLPDIVDSWRPFRVLDPLVYFATGNPCSLITLNRRDIP